MGAVFELGYAGIGLWSSQVSRLCTSCWSICNGGICAYSRYREQVVREVVLSNRGRVPATYSFRAPPGRNICECIAFADQKYHANISSAIPESLERFLSLRVY